MYFNYYYIIRKLKYKANWYAYACMYTYIITVKTVRLIIYVCMYITYAQRHQDILQLAYVKLINHTYLTVCFRMVSTWSTKEGYYKH